MEKQIRSWQIVGYIFGIIAFYSGFFGVTYATTIYCSPTDYNCGNTTLNYTTTSGSGACSYHGGVNCSVGPTITGHVQCNDGWVNSSVLYSNTNECKTQNSCILPQSLGYKYTADAQCSGLAAQGLGNGSAQFTPEIFHGQIQDCENQVRAYQTAVQNYNNCLTIQQNKLTLDTEIENTQEKINALKQANNLSTQICDPNSYLDKSKNLCICKSGYVVQNSRCVLVANKAPALPVKTPVMIINQVNTYGNTFGTNETSKEINSDETKNNVTPVSTDTMPQTKVNIFNKAKNWLMSLFSKLF